MKNYCLLFICFTLVIPSLVLAQHEHAHGDNNDSMKMQHLSVIMNNGFVTSMEATNLQCTGTGKENLDAAIEKHSALMFNMGRDVLNRTMNGPEMKSLMGGDHSQHSAHMMHIHKRGELMRKYINVLKTAPKNHETMSINHALSMASEGTNLLVLSEMKMAGTIDKFGLIHGSRLISKGRSFLDEIQKNSDSELIKLAREIMNLYLEYPKLIQEG